MKVNLWGKKNNDQLEAVIEKIADNDYPLIQEGGNYLFDWRLEQYYDVYKIYLKSNANNVLGVMSLIDYFKERRIHINLLEVGIGNKGRLKQIDNIAGCLIAFAARISFERGYDGIVTIEPKNKLFKLYRDKYGFTEIGYMMDDRQQRIKSFKSMLGNFAN